MKITKTLILIFTVVLFSCGNDDDGNRVVLPIGENIRPSSIIDVEAVLARAAGSDITDLITFGDDSNVPAYDYTSEVNLYDTFTLGSPQGLATGDEFLYSDVLFLNQFDEEVEVSETDYIVGGYIQAVLPEGVTGISVDDYYGQMFIPTIAFDVIYAEEFVDVNWKYDIECYIRRGGDEFGPYYIDPKLRIKGRTSLN